MFLESTVNQYNLPYTNVFLYYNNSTTTTVERSLLINIFMLSHKSIDGRKILKCFFKRRRIGHGLTRSVSGYGEVKGSCLCGNEPSEFQKMRGTSWVTENLLVSQNKAVFHGVDYVFTINSNNRMVTYDRTVCSLLWFFKFTIRLCLMSLGNFPSFFIRCPNAKTANVKQFNFKLYTLYHPHPYQQHKL